MYGSTGNAVIVNFAMRFPLIAAAAASAVIVTAVVKKPEAPVVKAPEPVSSAVSKPAAPAVKPLPQVKKVRG